jgi:hypothetical protein
MVFACCARVDAGDVSLAVSVWAAFSHGGAAIKTVAKVK